ncbi:MAG TPA: nucleotidyltransferase domain-containing protein, partial [Anaerolineales bacterium]|nr:nucleotidyltransferase domain-containing protein [Anaerolineales bacterium]
MKALADIKQILREQKPFLAQEYGVKVIGVFGSYVRYEQRADSDLDVLIELERPPKISLIGLVEL